MQKAALTNELTLTSNRMLQLMKLSFFSEGYAGSTNYVEQFEELKEAMK